MSLGSKNDAQDQGYYKCFGHYDIVKLSLRGPSPEHTFNISPNVLQCISLFGIRWSDPSISKPLPEWLADAPLILLVLFKLHPSLLSNYGLKGEMRVLQYLAHQLQSADANLMTSLGHSEVLAFLKGEDLSTMLRTVAKIRDEATIGDVFQDNHSLSGNKASPLPAFAKSTSFPLISYELVLDGNHFDRVRGLVKPVVTIRCQPGSDEAIASSLRKHAIGQALECYGKEDILLWFQEGMEIGDFTSKIMSFREDWRDHPGLYSTLTFFLGVPEHETERRESVPDEASLSVPVSCQEVLNRLAAVVEGDWLEDSVVGEVVSFANRLSSCAADPYICVEFGDMLGFTEYLVSLLTTMKDDIQKGEYDSSERAKGILLDQIHTANEALYQRYSGIEAHLEGVPFPPFFSHAGINRVVLAAADFPFFAINEGFAKVRDDRYWPGFVTFSESSPFQVLNAEILSFPSRSLFAPVDEWPTISHEISHIAERVLKFREHTEPSFKDLIRRLRGQPFFTEREMLQLWDEMFAHWFDFCYFFEAKDIDYFIEQLWVGWLKVPMVWRGKDRYLLRSLLMYIWGRYQKFVETSKGRKERQEFIKSCYSDMVKRLGAKSQRFQQFMAAIKLDDEEHVLRGAFWLSGVFRTFEIFKELSIENGLYQRLNVPYQNLEQHLNLLENGKVVCDEIPNPKTLLFQLKERLLRKGVDIHPRVSLAVILTLSNDYRRRQRLLLGH
jgi:hypothetical protein